LCRGAWSAGSSGSPASPSSQPGTEEDTAQRVANAIASMEAAESKRHVERGPESHPAKGDPASWFCLFLFCLPGFCFTCSRLSTTCHWHLYSFSSVGLCLLRAVYHLLTLRNDQVGHSRMAPATWRGLPHRKRQSGLIHVAHFLVAVGLMELAVREFKFDGKPREVVCGMKLHT